MRKIYKQLLIALLTMMPVGAWAQTQFTQGDFTYTVTDEVNKTVSVKQKDGEVSGDLVIPAQVENESVTYTVTSIAASGFRDNDNISSVVFPATIRSTGASAFEECSSIWSLTLNEGLETIGEYLIWCTNDDVKANTYLGEITIPSTVTSLGKGSFYGCRNLSTVNFPGSDTASDIDLNTASYEMFGGSPNYTLNLDRNITFSAGYSFAPFKGVVTVNIGSHVTSLPGHLFHNSTSLGEINMSNTVTTMGDYCFAGCTSLGDISSCLSTSMTEIPEYAFANCTNLYYVTIPSHITTLHASAFWYIKFEDNYTQIALTIEDSPNPLTIYDSGSSGTNDMPFYDVDIIGAYIGRDIIRTATEGNTAFATACLFNTKLTSVTFGPQVTTIGDHMFDGSTSLNQILFEEGSRLTTIGEGAFKNIEANFAFAMPNTVVTLGDQAFQNSGITEFQLSDHLTTIGDYAFENCDWLYNVTIPASVTKIGHYAFANCNASFGNGDFSLTIEDSDDPIEFVCNNSWPQFCDFPNLFVYLGRNITVTGTGGITTPFHSNVRSLEIGPKVTSLPDVKNLSNLTSVKTHIVTPLAIADDAFHSDTYAGNLYVPGGTLSAYKAATGWKNFANVETWSYVVDFAAVGHGTIAIDDELAGNGENKRTRKPNGGTLDYSNYTVALTPETGYELTSLTHEDKTEGTDPEERFVGNSEFTNPFVIETAINHDVAWVATFTPITYNITYDLAGGTVATANPATYNIETAITLNNPTREGYNFAGWTGTGLDAPTVEVTIAAGNTGDRSYTATWTPIIYTITYDLAGGSVATANPTTYTIESAAITLNNPTRVGYNFTGWKLNGVGEAMMSVTIAAKSMGNKAYTATWTPINYAISYDLAGGTVATANPTTYNIESAAITLNNPTREGYNFAGWTGTGLTEATTTVTIAKGSTGERSYTATWTPINYDITLTLDGGTATNPATYTIESDDITLNNPTKTGYTFKGWKLNGAGEAMMSVTIAAGSTGNKAYTATWQINQYTITFDSNGGSTVPSITQDFATAVTAPADPTREGYTFTGWNQDVPTTIPAENVTLTAQWTINQYTITFNTNGGTTIDPIKQDYNSAVTAPANPTREGYTFAGWDNEIPTVIPAENVTITASWTPITYTLSYDLAGGSLETANPTSYNIESAAITLNNPTKEHFDFAGWTGTGLDAATKTVVIATGSTGNRSYTATWTKKKYTVVISGGNVTADKTNPEYGDDVVLTIISDEDAELVKLTVDGVDVTANIVGDEYTITNVSANVQVVATWNKTKEYIIMAHSQATFSCTQDLDFTGVEGLKVYVASGFNKSTGKVLMTQIEGTVPAGTGLFLEGTEGVTYKVPYTTSDAYYVSLLKPVVTAQVVPTTDGAYTNFLYGEKEGVKGFYKSSGSGTVAAGKAYLQLPSSAVADIKGVGFEFDDETAISSVKADVVAPEGVYDIKGRKIPAGQKLTRGIYVINGKKVSIK